MLATAAWPLLSQHTAHGPLSPADGARTRCIVVLDLTTARSIGRMAAVASSVCCMAPCRATGAPRAVAARPFSSAMVHKPLVAAAAAPVARRQQAVVLAGERAAWAA